MQRLYTYRIDDFSGGDKATLAATSLKVMHIIDELGIGGTQVHMLTVMREWVRRRQDSHLVVCLFGDGALRGAYESLGSRVHLLDLRNEIRSHRFLEATKKIRQVIEEFSPDVIEAHLSYSRVLGLWAARQAGIHRRFGFEKGDTYLTSWPWRLLNFASQLWVTRFLTCSFAMKRWMSETHGILPNRVTVLHNCLDPESFKPTSGLKREDIDVRHDAFLLCAVGSLGRGVNKRVDVLIRGLARAREQNETLELLVCGDGELRPGLEELSRDLGVSMAVHFLGTRKDIADIFNISDAFCHATPFEPFGIVCLEALWCGKPVIAPDSGGITEIFDSGIEGLKYPACDEKRLAERMLELAASPEAARKMGLKGREKIERQYLVGDYFDRLMSIYQIDGSNR